MHRAIVLWIVADHEFEFVLCSHSYKMYVYFNLLLACPAQMQMNAKLNPLCFALHGSPSHLIKFSTRVLCQLDALHFSFHHFISISYSSVLCFAVSAQHTSLA